MIKKLFIISILSALGVTLALPAFKVGAVTASDWQAGRIVDDVVFTNKNAMGVADIQNFLNQKVGTTQANGTPGVCDTNGTKTSELGDGSRAHYGADHGNPAPFTCLNNYYEVSKLAPGPGIPANNYGGKPIPAGAQSAAQIIWSASQEYNINPEVLLVTLQKESVGPLVTDDWPFQSQYLYAMGAHCPDSGPGGSANCDTNYAGFSLQISESAALYRYYLDNMTQPWWPYKKLGNNAIQYDVSTSCGSSNVNIITSATAALYTYTPYQPNAAALANMYGTGDGCSAYGNRNFWRMFSDWFGSTYAPNYSWQLTSQYAYTDVTKATPVNINSVAPGQRMYVGFTAKNTGNMTWTNSGPNAMLVGTAAPLERSSRFSGGSGWLSSTKPALMKEASVAPGQTGTFEFYMTAPSTPGSGGIYNERFNLLSNGVTWLNDVGLSYYFNVQAPTYSWQMTSQYAYTDVTKATPVNINSVAPGQRMYVGFTAKNTGNMTWTNSGPNAMLVGTAAPLERSSRFSGGSGWLSSTKPALMKEASVAPGQTGTFEFYMTAPSTPGSGGIYNERFNLLSNGVTWLNDVGLSYYFNVQAPTYSWQMTSQYAYTDVTKATPVNINSVAPGQRMYVGFTAKNTGNMTWTNSGPNAMLVGTAAPLERSSRFSGGSGWLSSTKPALMKEASVAPGQTGTFEFYMTAPSTPGSGGIYNERFNLLSNGVTWLNDVGLSYYFNVH